MRINFSKINYILYRLPYVVLCLTTCFAAFKMPPDEYPFGCASCSVGIIYAFYGLVGGRDCEMGIVTGVVDDLQDFMPIGLMNIEIFKAADKSYAMVHALFVFPLLLDLIAKLFGEENDDAYTQILKNVNNVGNIISLLYLSYAEDNYMYGCVALSSLAAHTGMIITGKCHGHVADIVYIIFHGLFYMTSVLAIIGEFSSAPVET